MNGMAIGFSTLYKVEAYRPVPVQELRYLAQQVGRVGLVLPETGVVTVKQARLLLPQVKGLFADFLKWRESFHNLVVNTGLNDNLDKYFKGSTYTAAFYVGLTDGTPTVAAGDTMASHAGWTEVTAYDEATREVLTLGTVASQSVDNSASAAQFTIDTNSTTIGGAFVTTNNTKGGSTGTLYGAGAFTAGDKSLDDNDTLDVTVTLTAAAS